MVTILTIGDIIFLGDSAAVTPLEYWCLKEMLEINRQICHHYLKNFSPFQIEMINLRPVSFDFKLSLGLYERSTIKLNQSVSM